MFFLPKVEEVFETVMLVSQKLFLKSTVFTCFMFCLVSFNVLPPKVEEVFESVMKGAKREYPVAQVSLFNVITIAFTIMVIVVIIVAFIVTIIDNSNEQHRHNQFCSVDRWHRLPHNPLDRADSCPLPGADPDPDPDW